MRVAQEPATRAEADRQRREEKSRNAPAVQARAASSARCTSSKRRASSSSAGKGSIRSSDRSRPEAASRTAPAFAIATCSTTRARWICGPRRASRRYWATEARLTFPKLAHKRLHRRDLGRAPRLPAGGFLRHRPRLGSRPIRPAMPSDRTSSAPASASARSRSCWPAAALEYLNPRLGRGKDSRVPSIEALFDPSTAPGLGESVDYLRSMAFLEVDYREPKNARKGGWYRVDFSRFDDRTTGRYTFNRVDTDLRQFVGFLAGRRVHRGAAVRLDVRHRCRHVMPFYLDADARRKRHAARIPRVPLPGTARDSGAGGVSLGDLERARRRAVLRCRQSRQPSRRSEFQGSGDATTASGSASTPTNAIVFRVDAGFGSRDGKHLYIVFGGIF